MTSYLGGIQMDEKEMKLREKEAKKIRKEVEKRLSKERDEMLQEIERNAREAAKESVNEVDIMELPEEQRREIYRQVRERYEKSKIKVGRMEKFFKIKVILLFIFMIILGIVSAVSSYFLAMKYPKIIIAIDLLIFIFLLSCIFGSKKESGKKVFILSLAIVIDLISMLCIRFNYYRVFQLKDDIKLVCISFIISLVIAFMVLLLKRVPVNKKRILNTFLVSIFITFNIYMFIHNINSAYYPSKEAEYNVNIVSTSFHKNDSRKGGTYYSYYAEIEYLEGPKSKEKIRISKETYDKLGNKSKMIYYKGIFNIEWHELKI